MASIVEVAHQSDNENSDIPLSPSPSSLASPAAANFAKSNVSAAAATVDETKSLTSTREQNNTTVTTVTSTAPTDLRAAITAVELASAAEVGRAEVDEKVNQKDTTTKKINEFSDNDDDDESTEDESNGVYDEIPLSDMTFNEDEGKYTYPCPCGDLFELFLEDLEDGEDIAYCPSCSLKIRVTDINT